MYVGRDDAFNAYMKNYNKPPKHEKSEYVVWETEM